MPSFAIDQGNSNTKIAFFEDRLLISSAVLTDETMFNDMEVLFEKYLPTSGIFSSVRSSHEELMKLLEGKCETLFFTRETPLFFDLDYATPQTLGSDRKANAAAAITEFGRETCLVVDCGTCITYTLVQHAQLKGGAISPGLKMRLKALHHYTGRLPELQHAGNLPNVLGKSTEASIRSGVELAIVLEVEKMIEQYCSHTGDMNVLLTGGAMPFFEQHLKTTIFARPNLTLTGLNEILLYQKRTE